MSLLLLLSAAGAPSVSYTADGIVFATNTTTYTADGIVLVTGTTTYTADAIVSGTSYTTTATRAVVSGPSIVATGGTIGTSAAHCAFPTFVMANTGDLVMHYRKGTAHNSYDGVLVQRTSTDQGATWSAESTVWSGDDQRSSMLRRLASGRLVSAIYRRTSTPRYYAEFAYSDDHGATWSTPAAVTTGHASDVAVGDDIVELANGDLLYFSYGKTSFAASTWDVRVSRSTDDGATWSALALIAQGASYGGANAVEAQAQLLPDGTVYCMFHTEDGLPTDIYYTTSSDSGATWATPTLLHDEEQYNRNGVVYHPDGDLIDTYANASVDDVIRQSFTSGVSYGSAVTFQTDSSTSPKTSPVWTSPEVIGDRWDSPNLGVATAWERGGQDQADVYFTTFSNGAAWSYNERTAAYTADAIVSAGGLTTTYTADAVIAAPAYAVTYTADGIVFATNTKTYTVDAVVADSASQTTALSWFFRRRRSSMTPTKTYTVVQAKGTTQTATWTSPTYKSETEAGILVVLDVTAASGTGGLTLRVNAQDSAGGVSVPLNSAPTAVTTVGTTSYAVYPFGAISGALTQSTSGYLPRQFSITVTHGDSSSYTYSVGFTLLP